MSEFSDLVDAVPDDLKAILSSTAIDNGLCTLLSALFAACRQIGTTMRNGDYSHEEAGTINTSGDDQLHIDLATEAVIFDKLKQSGI